MKSVLLALVAGLTSLGAYEGHEPPDDAARFESADLVIQAVVRKVVLPEKLSQPTEVVLEIQRSLKGASKPGDFVQVHHDSGEAAARTEGGMTVAEHAFRCPAFPKFTPGEFVTLYARWDGATQRYFVPDGRWKVTSPK